MIYALDLSVCHPIFRLNLQIRRYKNENERIAKMVFKGGGVDKKLYWTLMRENYTHVLPEVMELLKNHEECKSITITADDVVLEKQSGLKMFFNFQESFSRAEVDLCNASDPEKEDIKAISKLMLDKNCKVAFDIGANVGMFSLELSYEHPQTDFYLFEPIPITYSKLLKTLELNGKNSEKFHTYNIGMSNKIGSFDFYLPGESEAASLQPIDDPFYRKKSDEFGIYTGSTEMDKVKCSVSTVDEFFAANKIETVDFMKIDVEGNEKFVLEGSKEVLKQFHPLIYCELLRKHAKRFGYHPNDVIDYMREFGYKCQTVRNGSLIDIASIDDSTEETNFIFLS